MNSNVVSAPFVVSFYNVMIAEAHVRPPPKATRRIVSPGLARPSRIASSRAIGTDAADVLPYFARFTMTLSRGKPVDSRAESMIR